MSRLLPPSSRTRVVSVLVLIALASWAGSVLAHSGGISGDARSTTGCSCHSSTPNKSGVATVQITGPQSVAPGSTNSYTISVSGGPAGSFGGFDLVTTSGTLVAGASSQLFGSDLTHVDELSRSWTFSWTAPSTARPDTFYAVAQATNGSGTSGDSWNWYGGAVNTPFVIAVAALGVGAAGPSALSLSAPSPNPFSRATRVDFTLARPGAARVEVFDSGGRRVATLAAGELAAGAHSVNWSGLSADGGPAPSGVYFVRLTAEGRSLTRRVMRLQ